MFRVVADQLKISEGWVRCGHCADVFDATLYLDAWGGAKPQAPATAVASPAAAVSTPTPAPTTAPVSGAGPDDDLVAGLMAEMAERDTHAVASPTNDPVATDLLPSVEESDRQSPDVHAPDPVHEADIDTLPPPMEELRAGAAPVLSPEREPDFQAELLRFAGAQARSAVVTESSDPATAPLGQPAPSAAPSAPASHAAPGTPGLGALGHEVPGFVRQARRRAFWQSTPVRLALHGLALLLASLLLVQWAVHERDWLAARQPVLKPWLLSLCEPWQCQVKPLRRIESVVIDSSELVRRVGDLHSFEFVLKNTASVALAMPALELTLTDARDTAIARRVFLPSDWPSAPSELAAGSSMTVSLRLIITADGATPMTGYRALIFYPGPS